MMTERVATRSFDVTFITISAVDAVVGTLAISKMFHGDLDGSSAGQMLAIGTAVEGSAGYVAMERVTGALDSRTGSFALQHAGSMNRGTPSLSISVVPDSGTAGLVDLTGRIEIKVEGGKHLYTLRYSFAGD